MRSNEKLLVLVLVVSLVMALLAGATVPAGAQGPPGQRKIVVFQGGFVNAPAQQALLRAGGGAIAMVKAVVLGGAYRQGWLP